MGRDQSVRSPSIVEVGDSVYLFPGGGGSVPTGTVETLVVKGELVAESDGTSTAVGVMDAVFGALSAGVATVDGDLTVESLVALAGTSDGVGSVTGALIQELVGSSAGVATVAGALTNFGTNELAGTSDGVASVSGALTNETAGGGLSGSYPGGYAGGYGGTLGDTLEARRITAPATVDGNTYTYDSSDTDEFDDESIAGAWTEINKSVDTVTWYEEAHALCVIQEGADNDGDGPAHALVRSITGSSGVIYFESCFRFLPDDSANPAVGLVLSDGTGLTGTNQAVLVMHTDTTGQGQLRFSLRDFNDWSSQQSTEGGSIYYNALPGHVYIRLSWDTSDDTITAQISLDGIKWMQLSSAATYVAGFTPTHAGVYITRWGSTDEPQQASFEYFRVYTIS